MVNPSFLLERQYSGCILGVDEVGIGCWAGDVFAAAAMVPFDTPAVLLDQINDSKKLNPAKRAALYAAFAESPILFCVASASLAEIEEYNIRGAALKAMERAIVGVVDQLGESPVAVLVDGTMVPSIPYAVETVVKGDQKSYSIAAASIAAKVVRDQYMEAIGQEYPAYGWASNAGYGTKQHQAALAEQGVTPYHRRTYAPIKKLLELF